MPRIDLGGLVRPLFGSGETRSATYPILPDPKSEAFPRGLARQKCLPGRALEISFEDLSHARALTGGIPLPVARSPSHLRLARSRFHSLPRRSMLADRRPPATAIHQEGPRVAQRLPPS